MAVLIKNVAYLIRDAERVEEVKMFAQGKQNLE